MAFTDVVQLLDRSSVVAIVTRRADGSRMATPIWSMVVDGVPYIRSAFGEGSWWYRHVLAGREVAFVLGDGAIAEKDRDAALALPAEVVRVELLSEDDPAHPIIDAVLHEKYADEPESVVPMVSPEARRCTLRVLPATP